MLQTGSRINRTRCKRDPVYVRRDPVYVTQDPVYVTQDPVFVTLEMWDPVYETRDPLYETRDPAHVMRDPVYETLKETHWGWRSTWTVLHMAFTSLSVLLDVTTRTLFAGFNSLSAVYKNILEFFRIEFYRIYSICRRLFLVVIFIFKVTKNSFLWSL